MSRSFWLFAAVGYIKEREKCSFFVDILKIFETRVTIYFEMFVNIKIVILMNQGKRVNVNIHFDFTD